MRFSPHPSESGRLHARHSAHALTDDYRKTTSRRHHGNPDYRLRNTYYRLFERVLELVEVLAFDDIDRHCAGEASELTGA